MMVVFVSDMIALTHMGTACIENAYTKVMESPTNQAPNMIQLRSSTFFVVTIL